MTGRLSLTVVIWGNCPSPKREPQEMVPSHSSGLAGLELQQHLQYKGKRPWGEGDDEDRRDEGWEHPLQGDT